MNHFSAVVRLYRFVMRTEAAPKKSPASIAAGGDKVARAAHSEEFGGVHGSARPLLRNDAAGKQQQRNDEQGAAHAVALDGLRFARLIASLWAYRIRKPLVYSVALTWPLMRSLTDGWDSRTASATWA